VKAPFAIPPDSKAALIDLQADGFVTRAPQPPQSSAARHRLIIKRSFRLHQEHGHRHRVSSSHRTLWKSWTTRRYPVRNFTKLPNTIDPSLTNYSIAPIRCSPAPVVFQRWSHAKDLAGART